MHSGWLLWAMELLRICVRIYLLSGIIQNERENPTDWGEWDINMDVTKRILYTKGLLHRSLILLCIRKLSWKTRVGGWVECEDNKNSYTCRHQRA